ncbi:GyrI-like domain-containing protein [Aureicoccus marinus]|uniref:Transcriptional regulator n=1 Tax=Aureicoccus marinus TaxID=754435 RepID=A0A2S7TA77_9FLAO|nr:GyrI-like domain-containing protein [Aureicoccus marinus]PQJ16471.1 transcriptional regulator [Aureicoccus marinus]
MKKKIALVALALVLGSLLWYLFLRPYDARARWEVKALPGTINQTLKAWDKSLPTDQGIAQGDDLTELIQLLPYGDSLHQYRWELNQKTDSTTQIVLYVTDKNNSVSNRLASPFSTTALEQRTLQNVTDFRTRLKDHLNNTRVTFLGEEELGTTFCAYIPVASTQWEKAAMMMKHQPLLSQVLAENEVQLNGLPFIEVTKWNQTNDSIYYNFCFPIIRSERLPNHPEIKYKRLFSKKVLKAEYNGNYITSDRAWYALQNYAERNGIAVENTPIEFFYNNPNMGGNALSWKAEVFLPLKTEESNE